MLKRGLMRYLFILILCLSNLSFANPTLSTTPFPASSLTEAPKALEIGDLRMAPEIPGRAAPQLARDDELNLYSATKLGITDRVNKLIAENSDLTSKISMSIQVKDLKTGQEIYALNPYQRMVPASVTKSFIAYAALAYLKPTFTYSTQILAKPSKIDSNGTLNDNLYIKFSGDPSLTKLDLDKLIAQLKTKNIKQINGDIIIDDQIFDQAYQAEGWSWDDNKFCYAAPTSAIVIDQNCLQMILKGGALFVNVDPEKAPKNACPTCTPNSFYKAFAKFDFKIVTKNDSTCSPHLIANPDNSYSLTGCIDVNSKDLPLNIAYQDPRLMISALIESLLVDHNIAFNQQILFKASPSGYDVISEHKSENLSELVTQMMKNSDNIAADNFMKTIGAIYYKTQGNFKNGRDAVAAILSADTKIDFTQIRMVDGSGGSRYNLISADQLVSLYIAANKNSSIWSYFYDSLPISTLDGSIKTKFADYPELHGKVHAKTGSMGGVSNLSGYLERDNGQTLVFAIMINGYIGPRADASKFIEQILAAITE